MGRYRLFAIGITLVAMLAMLASACAPTAAPTPKPEAPKAVATTAAPTKEAPKAEAPKPLVPPVKVKVGLVLSAGVGGVFIADARGYFKEQGIEVETTPMDTGPRLLPALASGQLDVGYGSTGAGLFNAIARGVDIKIVSGGGQEAEGWKSNVIAVRPDLIESGVIKDYPDFKGKTIAVAAKDGGGAIEWDRALAKGNLKLSDVNVVEMGYGDMLAALTNKSIDAAVEIEPLATLGKENKTLVIWKYMADTYPNHQTAVYLYSPQFVAKPEVARRFMIALLKGNRDLSDAFSKNKDREAVVSILSNATKIDPAVINKMGIPKPSEDGYGNAESMSYDQDWYTKQGFVQQKVDMNKVIDYQFADYAVGVLGKYRP